MLGPWWKPDTLFSPALGSRFVRAHLERKHLPRTTPESRRYRNSIRQVQRRVRQRHQPDLDLVFVRRHEVDAAITRKETRDRDKLHPAHRRRTRIPIRRFPFNSPLLFRHQHKVKTKLTVVHRYDLIAHFKVGVRKVGVRTCQPDIERQVWQPPWGRMSVMGQKRTWRSSIAMSALCHKQTCRHEHRSSA
jgi:hypothetical protein